MRVLGLILAALAGPVFAESVETNSDTAVARFEGPTNRYGHGIMGDLPEWSRLCLSHAGQEACVDLPQNAVFEDMAPRLADMDGDGLDEAIVVESTTTGGGSLVVYSLNNGELSRVSTPPIGRRNRWLAPVGVADFDGNGKMDIAYVETPHLGKVLKIYEWNGDHLKLIAKASGVSNHRIGDETITSGVRDCGRGPEIVVPGARWAQVYSGRFVDGALEFEEEGPMVGGSVARYLKCN